MTVNAAKSLALARNLEDGATVGEFSATASVISSRAETATEAASVAAPIEETVDVQVGMVVIQFLKKKNCRIKTRIMPPKDYSGIVIR